MEPNDEASLNPTQRDALHTTTEKGFSEETVLSLTATISSLKPFATKTFRRHVRRQRFVVKSHLATKIQLRHYYKTISDEIYPRYSWITSSP